MSRHCGTAETASARVDYLVADAVPAKPVCDGSAPWKQGEKQGESVQNRALCASVAPEKPVIAMTCGRASIPHKGSAAGDYREAVSDYSERPPKAGLASVGLQSVFPDAWGQLDWIDQRAIPIMRRSWRDNLRVRTARQSG